MPVSIKHKNGNRYGTFDICGIKGNFPTQAITSTNLNHIQFIKNPNFDFKTKITEIIEFKPRQLIDDSEYRERRLEQISKMMNKNPGYLFLFTLNGVRGTKYKNKFGKAIIPFEFTKANNKSLIDFQQKAGFPLIKVFFKTSKSIKDSNYYRSLIPKGKFIAVLDENLPHNSFTTLYKECIVKKDEIISFFGRSPSKSETQTNNNLNFMFLASNHDDKILRLTSFIQKTDDGLTRSLIYNYLGLDAYSFMTRRGNPNIVDYKMKVLDGFFYKPLQNNTTLICPITGKNLYKSSKYFEIEHKKSSLPVTIHDIVMLNDQFEKLPERYTKNDIEKILENRI